MTEILSKSEILVVTWDGGGNVPPALLIAIELHRRGHGVRVLGHPALRGTVTAAGLAFRPYPTAAEFRCVEVNSVPRVLALFTDRRIGSDAVDEARRVPTDVVVVDCLLVGAQRACADAGLRYVSLEHLFDGYLRGGWLRGPMGAFARLKGLRPVRSWNSADRAIVVSSAALDPAARRPRPANLVYTGPALDLPSGPHDFTTHPPTILITLSTYAYAGMTQCLQRLMDATAGMAARVIVTTGPVIDPAELHPAANHEVHQYVPHDELMPQASLMIGHGGHSTTMRALAHDLPMVLMPMHAMLDQPLVARAVADSGAGMVVPKKAKPATLRPIIERLLAPGPHRSAAAALGRSIRDARGTERAADEILSVAAEVTAV